MNGRRDAVSGTARPTATPRTPRRPRPPLTERWGLDPDVVFLNHGPFGACRLEDRLHDHVADCVALADALRGLRVLFET